MEPVKQMYETGVRALWRFGTREFERYVDTVHTIGTPTPGAGAGQNPLLLVGGYANSGKVMGAIKRSFERDGFDATAITLDHFGQGSMSDQVAQTRRAVEEIRQRTGAEHVDIIGYSSGGYVARGAALDHNPSVGRVVTYHTGNEGLRLGPLGHIMPSGVRQIFDGTDFIRNLHDTRLDYDTISVGTRGFDGFVAPAASEVIPGKPFVSVDDNRRFGKFSLGGATHVGAPVDGIGYDALRSAVLAPRS